MSRFALLAALLTASLAHAGFYNETDGAAIQGHDPVAYFTEGKPLRGNAEHRLVYQGSTFQFASAANRERFSAEPGKYAPQYGGYCAFGAARGYKADAQPEAFAILDGKLYLNYNGQVQQTWLSDTAGYIRKADGLWPQTQKIEKVIR